MSFFSLNFHDVYLRLSSSDMLHAVLSGVLQVGTWSSVYFRPLCGCCLAIYLNLQTYKFVKSGHYFTAALNFGRLFSTRTQSPSQVLMKDMAADRPISITNTTQVILSARGQHLLMHASLIGKMRPAARQTGRPRGNLIPLLRQAPEFHHICVTAKQRMCAGMYVV